jgi:hypothetical protein
MRSSLKLLIGLAMPGLALAAYWLLRARRPRDQENNHGNGIDRARELRDVAEEFKIITHKTCANDDARKILDHNGFVDRGELKSNRKETDVGESVNSKLEVSNNVSETILAQTSLGTCPEDDAPLGSSNSCITESSEIFSNKRDNFIGTNDSSNACIEIGSFQNSEKTNGQSRSNQDQSESWISNGHAESSQSVESKLSPSHSPEIASASENIKPPNARAQSLDESSDMSSIDSKADSPLDQKMGWTAGSDCEPAQSEDETAEEVTWELEFPQALCGRLIGKKGKNVQKISQITGTKIRLIPQKENSECSQRLVALTGFPKQLKRALRALREKFPGVPFTRLNGSQPFAEINPGNPVASMVCVALPENELCQVFVTNIVDANHFHVQLYDYSVHSHLRQLDQQMYQCYSAAAAAGTMVPQTINTGMLCAALSPSGWWWRAQVVGLLMKPDEVEITWLDYGGRTTMPTAVLRQLRYNYHTEVF